MTITYEVNIELDAAIEQAYRVWLREHMDEILALPGFIDAQVFETLDPAPPSQRIALSVHYRLHDEAALQAYFQHHAARLRGEGMARFGGKFQATRRVLRGVAR